MRRLWALCADAAPHLSDTSARTTNVLRIPDSAQDLAHPKVVPALEAPAAVLLAAGVNEMDVLAGLAQQPGDVLQLGPPLSVYLQRQRREAACQSVSLTVRPSLCLSIYLLLAFAAARKVHDRQGKNVWFVDCGPPPRTLYVWTRIRRVTSLIA